MGPRRTLQVSLIVAAAIAILLALSGGFAPADAAPGGSRSVSRSG